MRGVTVLTIECSAIAGNSTYMFLILVESGHDHVESAWILTNNQWVPTGSENDPFQLTLEIKR